MKPISCEELQRQLDNEFAWRQKEITFLEKNIGKSGSDTDSRSGIVLLYAHWEGFIKNAAEIYLKFVASKKLKHNKLQDCFIALALKKEVGELRTSRKTDIYIKVVDFMLNRLSEQANIPYEKEIKTQWNLKSEVLKEILSDIGLTYSPYEVKMNMIDVLVNIRNDIAYGQQRNVSKDETKKLFTEIRQLIRDIKTDIINAAAQESYKKGERYEPNNI